jgi:protein-S-isoprenylcysteine O-methyltransferase Ste14
MFDKIILLAHFIFGVYIILKIAGLNLGRYHWSHRGLIYVIPSSILLLIADIIAIWAIITNEYFESTVRIQKHGKQQVIKDGPTGLFATLVMLRHYYSEWQLL